MFVSDQQAHVQEAVQLLRQALAIVDQIENHAASAQLDHVIHMLQSMSGNSVGA